jgi:hypothetical protein
MGAAQSRVPADGAAPQHYVPPEPTSTLRPGTRPLPNHVGRRLFGCDAFLTDAAVNGPQSERRLILDYLYLAAIGGASLASVFAVDSCCLASRAVVRLRPKRYEIVMGTTRAEQPADTSVPTYEGEDEERDMPLPEEGRHGFLLLACEPWNILVDVDGIVAHTRLATMFEVKEAIAEALCYFGVPCAVSRRLTGSRRAPPGHSPSCSSAR